MCPLAIRLKRSIYIYSTDYAIACPDSKEKISNRNPVYMLTIKYLTNDDILLNAVAYCIVTSSLIAKQRK